MSVTAKAKALKLYDEIDSYVKEDLMEALSWAKQELTNHEGSGHTICLHIQGDKFVCSFAKAKWNADHCGEPMYEAPEAIVMAVCEYFSGV